MEFNASEVDVEKLEGFPRVKPGRYHMLVQAVDEKNDSDDAMVVDFEIKGGTLPSEIKKTFREYFHKSIAAQQRMGMFAIAVRLVTLDQIKQAHVAGQNLNIPFPAAVGRELIMDLDEELYEGKTRTKCGFGFYALDDPKVTEVPRGAGASTPPAAASSPMPNAGATSIPVAAGNEADAFADL